MKALNPARANCSIGIDNLAKAGTAFVPGGRAGIAALALRALDFGTRQTTKAPDGMARTLAVDQVTIPCLVSGSYTVTIDDKDNSLTITPGDTLSIVFNQCNDGIGGIVNGGMAMTVAAYSETATVADMTGSVSFQSLAMTSSAESFSLTGSAAFRFTETVKSDGYEGCSPASRSRAAA